MQKMVHRRLGWRPVLDAVCAIGTPRLRAHSPMSDDSWPGVISHSKHRIVRASA